MQEVVGNLWDFHTSGHWVCVTTNGTVKYDGTLVMGRGCAREARDRFRGLDRRMGDQVLRHGVQVTAYYPPGIIAFPVKYEWREKANLTLIRTSAEQLRELLARGERVTGITTPVILPRPGCGNGHRSWADVKPVIEDVLPDTVWVISPE